MGSVSVWLVTLPVLMSAVRAQFIPGIPSTGKTEFYLDTARDCGGTPREVGQSTVQVYGKSTIPQGSPTTSCTLILNTANERDPHRFKLEFLNVHILSPGVRFYIYDGEYNSRLMYAFSNQNGLPANLDFDFTTGQQVTFRLTRGSEDRDYTIHVVVTPVSSAIANCQTGNEPGCNEYNYKYRILGTKEIVGIVGGVFGLIVLIVIIIVVCCYRKQRGVTQKWKEEKLGNASLPLKRPLPPPQVNHNPRGRNRDRYRDRDSDRSSETSFNTDKNFSEKTFTSRGFSEKTISSSRNMVPPTYREAMRNRRTESESSADEHSFVRANDDHPQETFVERVVVPRTKTKTGSPKFQRRPPPPEEDMEYDTIEPKRKPAKAETVTKDTGTQDDDETEESDTDNESEEESETEEEESDEEEAAPVQDQADAVYSKPNKSKESQEKPGPEISQNQGAFKPPNPQQFQGAPGHPAFLPPGVHHPQPRYGYPAHPQPGSGAYPQYPRGPPPSYPHGQSYPQPRPDAYHQANFSVPLQSQVQPQQQPRPTRNRSSQKPNNREPATQPGHIPVYSYLVNRGYHPLDGRHSPVSTSTGASNLSGDRNVPNDDSDFAANLDSGVELMRRKN